MTSERHVVADFALTLFPSAIGRVGVAFTSSAIAGIQLPEATDQATVARLRTILSPRYGALCFEEIVFEESSAILPAHARSAIKSMQAHLAGRPSDFSAIKLDERRLTAFQVRVFERSRAIPSGEVRTYGELAREVSSPGAARAIGRAMATNPFPIVVPCHRVIGTASAARDAAFRPGGFSAYGGLSTKARLLDIERAPSAGAMARAAREAVAD